MLLPRLVLEPESLGALRIWDAPITNVLLTPYGSANLHTENPKP